jgi:hypothetical protein
MVGLDGRGIAFDGWVAVGKVGETDPIGRHLPRPVIIVGMNPTVLPAEPDRFPDQAASFMLDGPAGKLETISDVAEPTPARAAAWR